MYMQRCVLVDDPYIREAVMSSCEIADVGVRAKVDIYLSVGDEAPKKEIIVTELWLLRRLGAFVAEAQRASAKTAAELTEMNGVIGKVEQLVAELKRQ